MNVQVRSTQDAVHKYSRSSNLNLKVGIYLQIYLVYNINFPISRRQKSQCGIIVWYALSPLRSAWPLAPCTTSWRRTLSACPCGQTLGRRCARGQSRRSLGRSWSWAGGWRALGRGAARWQSVCTWGPCQKKFNYTFCKWSWQTRKIGAEKAGGER